MSCGFCLAKESGARWQTAHDVLVELKWMPGTARAQTTPPRPWRASPPRAAGLDCAACLSIALIALALAHFREKPSISSDPIPDSYARQSDLQLIDIPVVSQTAAAWSSLAPLRQGGCFGYVNLDTLAAEALPGTEDASFLFGRPTADLLRSSVSAS